MRVIVMHNPSAGQEDHSADELIGEIRRAGHEVIAHVERRKQLKAALEEPCDLVAVAGGDGTVSKAAEILSGRDVRLAVLPRGTANNVARVLGVTGDLAEMIAAWREAKVQRFDVGRASRGDDPYHFIEALGVGAFPRVIWQNRAFDDGVTDRAEVLARDRRLIRDRVAESPAKPTRLIADGEDLSGEYFMVEVFNTSLLGPNLVLAPAARPDDGRLDLVVAAEADRAALLDALDRGEPSRLPTRRVARVRIEGEWRRFHRDGSLIDEPPGLLQIEVEPRALQVLVPRQAARDL